MLCRRGSRLSSSAATLVGSNFGCGLGGGGFFTGGVSACCFGGSGLGGSGFFRSFFFLFPSRPAPRAGPALGGWRRLGGGRDLLLLLDDLGRHLFLRRRRVGNLLDHRPRRRHLLRGLDAL